MKTNYTEMILKCIDMIKTFNPVTHSIDTFVLEQIGDTTSNVSKKCYYTILVCACIKNM